MYISETRLTVRYAETDRMGIVHHSNYPVWYEAGRTEFIREMGMPYSEIEKSGVMLPLISLKCSFKSYAGYEDKLIVRTKIREYTGTRLIFYYEVVREDNGALISSGETEHAWTTSSLKPVNLRKFRPDLNELILRAMND
jgi:acyl-CoA thioester hydrolase